MNISSRFSYVLGLGLALLPILTGCPQMSLSLPAEANRATILSQCAQAVIACTSSWPTAVATVLAIDGQTVTATDDGFIVVGDSMMGALDVRLTASDSTAGNGATSLSYVWSTGATNTDPCSLVDGTQFSAQETPTHRLDLGIHYIRLRVQNDIIRDSVDTDICGVFGQNIASFDFVEIVVDVRSN